MVYRRNHQIRDGLSRAICDAMGVDPMIHLFGEAAEVKQHYDAPYILEKYPERVHTMPICEDGILNFAVGAALLGCKPVVDLCGSDFLLRAMDSICNTAAPINRLRPGQPEATIVIRSEFFHSPRLDWLFRDIANIRVMVPQDAGEAYKLMIRALNSPGLTLIFEDREIPDVA